jgi:transcription antitermination factor NusG
MRCVSNSDWQELCRQACEARVTKNFCRFATPTLTSPVQSSDGEQDIPLFPGYLFCRFNSQDRLLPILTTPGVMSIVGIGKTPVPISDEEIDSIKAVIRSGLHSQPAMFLCTGSNVVLERGPLSGLEGIVVGLAGNCHLIVSVTLLQRSISVQIDPHWVSGASSAGNFMLGVDSGVLNKTREYRA